MDLLLRSRVAPRVETIVEFDSEAWLLVGWTRSLPGWLALHDDHLAFADEEGDLHFCASLDAIDRIWSPWYYFGGGIKVRIAEQTIRLSFTRPNDQPEGFREPIRHERELQRAISTASLAMGKLGDIARGRELTRQWKRVLALH